MALAPLLMFLGGAATRPKSLYVGGQDVILSVPLDSVEVEEAGPGGVSSMRFTIDDPSIAFTLADGMDVRFVNNTSDVPIFTGWVQGWSYVPDFGQQGRRIEVVCQGVEALLDWIIIPTAITFPINTQPWTAVQSCLANAVWPGGVQLRAGTDTTVALSNGSQAFPLSTVHSGTFFTQAVTIQPGTMRAAMTTIYQAIGWAAVTAVFTVDFYNGLRAWRLLTGNALDTSRRPSDYTDLTVTDTSVGAIVAEGLSHEIDAGNIIRGVYITGGNAAGTGTVMDGTGLPGPIVPLTDTTILTQDDRNALGYAYLAGFGVGNRGNFDRQDHTPTLTIHPGSILTLTDVRAGQAAATYSIGSIRKTFQAVRETWTISYGGMQPSAVKSLRRLTRNTIN